MIKRIHRWLTLRCDHCGHRFRWKRDARTSFGNRDRKVWHGPCSSYLMWRTKAEERLAVLHLVMDVTEATEDDIKLITELRATSEDERTAMSNRAFRVFYDLEKIRTIEQEPHP